MLYTSESIEKVVELLSAFPSIGKKTAQRLTFFLLRQNQEFIDKLSKGLLDLKKNVKFCSLCFNYTESEICPICSSQKRNKTMLCVVEEPNDVVAIEKTGDFFGLYHVLHGAINPLDNINANDIKITELVQRMGEVEEVILALNPSIEGEVTTQYIAKLLRPLQVKVTRIARGMPIGTELEFVDEATISRALEGRVEV
jgi:recombination protein RecR